MFDCQILLSCLLFGCGAGLAAYACRDDVVRGFELIEQDLTDKLHCLRVPTTHLRSYLVAWAISLVCAFVGLGLLFDGFALALPTTALLLCAPWYVLRRLAANRRLKLENQWADAMVTFSSAVKAGLSAAQSLDILAGQCPLPVREEFRQIVGEYHLGKPLERTLTEAKARLRSENFSLFAAALLANRKSGGRLNETVDRISRSVLELQRLERKIHTETAQARKSAVYMALAPLLILTAYYFVDPANTSLLFTTLPGQILLSVVIVLDLSAYAWSHFILNPDI